MTGAARSSSRSTGRRPRARARWRAGSPSASASPISTPAGSTGRRRCWCWRPAAIRPTRQRRQRRRGGSIAALLADPRLRGEAVGEAASVVAAIPAVRARPARVAARFRGAARRPPGRRRCGARRPRHRHGRLPGRRRSSCFVTASARSARRAGGSRSCGQRGAAAIYDDVLQDMKERDARDSGRRVAPLRRRPTP